MEKEVTDDEIMAASKALGDTKASGIDGFNTKFFKATWSITWNDV